MPLNYMPAHQLAGTPRTGQYYHHSGQVNPAGVVAALMAGVVAAAVMAVPYAYADKYCPEVHLNGLICGLFGLALGVVPALMLKRFKVRNLPVSLAVIALVAAAGLYASWAAWEAILMRHGLSNLPRLIVHPDAVVAIARDINGVGTWGIGSMGSTPTGGNTTGWFLAFIWLAEAATLVGVALLVGRSMLAGKPFCDACDRWCEAATVVRTTAPVEAKLLREKLEAGDFAFVAALGPPTPDAGLTFKRQHCDQCGRLNTLSVTRRTVTRDRKGRAKGTQTKTLVDKLLVTPDDLKRMAPAATSGG